MHSLAKERVSSLQGNKSASMLLKLFTCWMHFWDRFFFIGKGQPLSVYDSGSLAMELRGNRWSRLNIFSRARRLRWHWSLSSKEKRCYATEHCRVIMRVVYFIWEKPNHKSSSYTIKFLYFDPQKLLWKFEHNPLTPWGGLNKLEVCMRRKSTKYRKNGYNYIFNYNQSIFFIIDVNHFPMYIEDFPTWFRFVAVSSI